MCVAGVTIKRGFGWLCFAEWSSKQPGVCLTNADCVKHESCVCYRWLRFKQFIAYVLGVQLRWTVDPFPWASWSKDGTRSVLDSVSHLSLWKHTLCSVGYRSGASTYPPQTVQQCLGGTFEHDSLSCILTTSNQHNTQHQMFALQKAFIKLLRSQLNTYNIIHTEIHIMLTRLRRRYKLTLLKQGREEMLRGHDQEMPRLSLYSGLQLRCDVCLWSRSSATQSSNF